MKIDFKKILWENKEGIIIGIIVGDLTARYFLPQIIDFSMITQTQGIVDILSSAGKTTLEIAKTKLIWAGRIIGALVGLYIDSILPEKWYKRLLK